MSLKNNFDKELQDRINVINKEKFELESLITNEEINKKIKILETLVNPKIHYNPFEEYCESDENTVRNVLWSSDQSDTICHFTFDFKKTSERKEIFIEIRDSYAYEDDCILADFYIEKEGYKFYNDSYSCLIDLYDFQFIIEEYLMDVKNILPKEFIKNKLNKKTCEAFELYLNNTKDIDCLKNFQTVSKKPLEKELMKVLDERMKREIFK